MTLKEIIDLIRTDGGSWAIIVLLFMTFIQIAPIKIDPWSLFAGWIGKQINKETNERLDRLEKRLNDHITDSNQRDIRQRREIILDFGNSCMNGRKHTKEEFDFIISECDKYERYCIQNNIPNGVAEATIKEIRRVYENCIRKNTFLQGGEYGLIEN